MFVHTYISPITSCLLITWNMWYQDHPPLTLFNKLTSHWYWKYLAICHAPTQSLFMSSWLLDFCTAVFTSTWLVHLLSLLLANQSCSYVLVVGDQQWNLLWLDKSYALTIWLKAFYMLATFHTIPLPAVYLHIRWMRIFVTQFAWTRHNDAFLEIQILHKWVPCI